MHRPRAAPLDFNEFREVIRRIMGTDFEMRDPSWLTRVASATFQADEYRRGRLLIAGDAAHVQFPMGGQGMNVGIQDAMNLGWKLAAVVGGKAGDDLLDSYHSERVPVGRAVIEDTLAQTAVVSTPGREGQALRAMLSTALSDNAPLNSSFARFVSGVGVSYPPAPGDHPLVGQRVPDLGLSDGGSAFAAMRSGQVVVFGVEPAVLAHHLPPGVAELVFISPARFTSGGASWVGPTAVVIRPDGHVAWASQRGADSEREKCDAVVRAVLRLLRGPVADTSAAPPVVPARQYQASS